jgi:hypothetical protein
MATLVVGAAQAHDSQPRLTLAAARRIVNEQGARRAIVTGLDSHWNELLAAIATAEPGWLDLAAELRANSDAESSATLDAAMGEALRQSPVNVLRRLDGQPFSVPTVCGNGFADLGILGATDAEQSLAAQAAAVAKVQDAKLKDRQSACLQRIRVQQRR